VLETYFLEASWNNSIRLGRRYLTLNGHDKVRTWDTCSLCTCTSRLGSICDILGESVRRGGDQVSKHVGHARLTLIDKVHLGHKVDICGIQINNFGTLLHVLRN